MLRRKYLSLGLGELVSAGVFVTVAVLIVSPQVEAWTDTAALWAAFIPLLIILIQAGVYWLCARSWVERMHMPPRLAAFYRTFQIVNVCLLASSLFGIISWLPTHPGLALVVVGAWIFGVIEHINYFVVRLAYPIQRWPFMVRQLRQPQLIFDLAASR